MDAEPLPGPLDTLARAYWDLYLEANPLFATSIGDPRWDDQLADPTPEGSAITRARYAALADRISALDRTGWDAETGITHSALLESISGDIALLDTGLLDWNVDSLEGVPADFFLVPDYQCPETPDEGRRLISRWREMATYTDAHLATLRRSLGDGRVACHAPVARTISILEEVLDRPDAESPLMAPLAEVDVLGTWTTAERERFAAALRDVVTTGIRPAFERLHDALVTEILPASRPDDRPGMCHVTHGDEGYRQLIRVHTSLDLGPDELHALGLAEIDRIDRELTQLAARTIGTTTLADALTALRGDPSLYFSTRDEFYAKAEYSLARATEAIPDWFGRLPQAACEIERMGSHEEEHSSIAYYRQPAPDGSRPGQYYLNTAHPETRPRYELEALTYHESIPGHHLQIAIGQELPQTAEFRRHLGPTAFFEGWGLYTERLADEMGLYTGDLDRIGVLSYDAWRAARLVVDTGMHAMGWPRDRAIEYMKEHTALASNNIVNEVDCYIVLPGQALAYKAGQLEMLRLRAETRDRMGPSFDIRAFHDVVLGNGAIPLPTLRDVVERWAERATAAA